MNKRLYSEVKKPVDDSIQKELGKMEHKFLTKFSFGSNLYALGFA